jgi:hypothetical protein
MKFLIFALPIFLLSPAHAAPQALYGKSVAVSWNETRSQRIGQDGAFKPVSIPYSVTFYVSAQGRLFTRTTARGGSGAAFGSNDRVGTSGGNGAGDARNATFSGNRLVQNTSFQGAGRHIEVTFDSGFSGCNAHVVTGMPRGAKTAVVRSIASGSNVEFESVSAGAASCSISSGNPF